MPWTLDNDRPIYIQIIERIESDIISGNYQLGEKLPSVRELAAQAAVNPNTMQKAFTELERKGLVYSQRTSGRFITDDKERIKTMRDEVALNQIHAFLTTMKHLGFSYEEIIQLLQRSHQGGK